MTDKLIDTSREYLEKVYIDFLRRKYPTFNDFKKYAHTRFNDESYVVDDFTKHWPRDIRVCLLNNLNLSDVVKLARTSKKWANVITNSSYDRYMCEIKYLPI